MAYSMERLDEAAKIIAAANAEYGVQGWTSRIAVTKDGVIAMAAFADPVKPPVSRESGVTRNDLDNEPLEQAALLATAEALKMFGVTADGVTANISKKPKPVLLNAGEFADTRAADKQTIESALGLTRDDMPTGAL